MKDLSVINDPVFNPKLTYTFFERILLKTIRDKRDLPFVVLTIKITLILVPLAILLFIPGVTDVLWVAIAAAYLILNNLYFKGPFGLMLHCSCHNKTYNKSFEWANYYLPWFIGLFFGQTPETYFTHHIGMHHIENNLYEDESSTMNYQRDSFKSFLKYFSLFIIRGLVDLTNYLRRKKRTKLARKSVTGELVFIILCTALSLLNWQATMVVFIIPLFISRFIMMLGNWTQHAFIDPSDPSNHYKNSITCINTKYNHKCWNDGYHISHHIKPTLHWTEHPRYFLRTKESYIENSAIVFDGIGFLEVFVFLMRKRYDLLEKNFVNIGNHYSSKEEVIALLKRRTIKIEKK